MTRCEKGNWLINIQNTATDVADEYGDDVVKSVLSKYNAACIEGLAPSDYEAAFSELYLIANDN